MTEKRFDEQMQAFGQWKEGLADAIQRYQTWLDENEMGDPEDELRIFEILGALRSDRLTIAFVAEFARGKTELINAIFFSEYDRRLLPSEAGRTTMCPTELFYDNEHQHAYIRLLPIESRKEDTSITELKDDPIHWTQIELQLDSPESMAEAFQEIVKTKPVPLAEARDLGLYNEADLHLHSPDGTVPKTIDVPMWRHALISFPHPLLKQGLVILDTPGLNALGSEPELTINMLPNAQAVIFVLAADTGVTKSDQEMWQTNVKPLRNKNEKGLIVVLNKIDTLWDELKDETSIERTVTAQCQNAAQTLGIEANAVVPVSAQKGLLAKIRHDQELMDRSNILHLENILSNDILPEKQRLVREHVTNEIGGMVKQSHGLLRSRLNATTQQLKELGGLSDKNNDVIEHLMKKTREEQVAYHKNVESFRANKKSLTEQSQKLLFMLSLAEVDKLVAETRKAMSDSWTTHGMKLGMKTFFDGIKGQLDEVTAYSDQLNRLVFTVYRKFQAEYNIPEVKPALYTTKKYLEDFQKLQQEAEAFRNSPVTVATEQSFVIKKFFISLVSHARNVFFTAHKDAEHWSKAVMSPLIKQMMELKDQMDTRLENLRKINESRDTLETRIAELEKTLVPLQKQFNEVNEILELINQPSIIEEIEIKPAAGAN
ncbi:MAG: dynamin family protein [Gammaproteobacteria bacterium]|nr:dynamin family protein [Gammaproteobacteria bacterium]